MSDAPDTRTDPTVRLEMPLSEARHLRDACHAWATAHMDHPAPRSESETAWWAQRRVEHAINTAEETTHG